MLFIRHLRTEPSFYLTWVIVVMFSICVHEFAHAWAAVTQGDMTAYRRGYFTLNPVKTMGVHSIVMLLVAGVAWGAVPINPASMRRRWSPALVACAGPCSNLVLALGFSACAVLTLALGQREITRPFQFLFHIGAMANFFLLIFNMLPIPMLDGWTVYSWIFPPLRQVSAATRAKVGLLVIVVLFVSPAGGVFWQVAQYCAVVSTSVMAAGLGFGP